VSFGKSVVKKVRIFTNFPKKIRKNAKKHQKTLKNAHFSNHPFSTISICTAGTYKNIYKKSEKLNLLFHRRTIRYTTYDILHTNMPLTCFGFDATLSQA
jgi:hypothetical protein